MHPLIISRFALAVKFLDVAKSELHFEGFRDDVNLSSLLSSCATKLCTSLAQVLFAPAGRSPAGRHSMQLGPTQLLKNSSALSTLPVEGSCLSTP